METTFSVNATPASRAEPMVWLACAWVTGLAVGAVYQNVWEYTTAAVALLLGAVWSWWSGARLHWVMALAVVAAAAAWWSVHDPMGVLERGLGAMIGEERRLMCVEGVVRESPHIRIAPPGGMESFTYTYVQPATSFIVEVDTVIGDGRFTTRGALRVSMPQIDTRIEAGDRVRCVGWAQRIPEPMNPGEFDFRAHMRRQGVAGRLLIDNRGNAEVLTMAHELLWSWRGWRNMMRQQAMTALDYGMPKTRLGGEREADPGGTGPQATALLEALVLGGRSAELSELYGSFRRTGLAHVLSISGLHVGILAGGTWWVVLVVSGRPRWAAIAALVAVGLYLLVVPWRVPIVRAGFMTVVCCLGLTWSRRISSMSVLSIIALAWLMARPGDLLDPGFQLSFGIVAALLLYTGRVARWLLPRDIFEDPTRRGLTLRRWGADYLAVSLVAWLVAMPIAAYHFRMFSSLAVLLNVMTFPLTALLLWVGMLKVALTLIWPAAGAMLAEPLLAMGRWCVDIVAAAEKIPGAWFMLPQPGAWWVLSMLAVVAALLGGWFAGRKSALATVVLICVGWLYAPGMARAWSDHDELQLHMLAVGDGSCFVVRSGGRAMMFDCGSGNYARIGEYTILPALRELGVRRIEALIISHPDLDHFAGVLDVVDGLRVDRVVTTAHTLADAQLNRHGATAYLLEQVRQRGMEIQTIEAGWSMMLGRAEVRAIWPPTGERFERNNDASIVLSLRAAGRRVLLCGDIQETAMAQMMAEGLDLAADVTELPHHGSFPPGAVEWLAEVGPQVVLQSSGSRRLQWDHWAEHLQGIARRTTAEHGMVSVRVDKEGQIRVEQYRR